MKAGNAPPHQQRTGINGKVHSLCGRKPAAGHDIEAVTGKNLLRCFKALFTHTVGIGQVVDRNYLFGIRRAECTQLFGKRLGDRDDLLRPPVSECIVIFAAHRAVVIKHEKSVGVHGAHGILRRAVAVYYSRVKVLSAELILYVSRIPPRLGRTQRKPKSAPHEPPHARRVLRLLHEIVHPRVPVRLFERHRVMPVCHKEPAFGGDARRRFAFVTQDKARHVIPLAVEPVQKIDKRRLDPADPERLGNEYKLFFHFPAAAPTPAMLPFLPLCRRAAAKRQNIG